MPSFVRDPFTIRKSVENQPLTLYIVIIVFGKGLCYVFVESLVLEFSWGKRGSEKGESAVLWLMGMSTREKVRNNIMAEMNT